LEKGLGFIKPQFCLKNQDRPRPIRRQLDRILGRGDHEFRPAGREGQPQAGKKAAVVSLVVGQGQEAADIQTQLTKGPLE